MIQLLPIEKDDVEEVWPLVRENFVRFCKLSRNRDTVEAYWQALMDGTDKLWVVWDSEKRRVQAVLITEIWIAPSGEHVCGITMTEGTGHHKWMLDSAATIESWAKEMGCVSMVIQARKGIVRLLKDYNIRVYMIEKILDHPKELPHQNEAGLQEAQPDV